MKRVLFSLALFLLLGGCAVDVATYHARCMENGAAFAEQVACVRASVASEPSLKNDTLVQEYILAGEELVKQVQEGKLTEAQARLMFTRRLNDIQQRQADLLAQQARAANANDFTRPHFTNCHRAGSSVECTSY